MNILSLLTYTSFLIYLSFGIYILYLNKKETINRIFALLSFSLAIWSIADTFYYIAPDKKTAMIFWRISTIGWILSPAFMLHLMLLVGKFYRFTNRFYKLIILYTPTLILQTLALTTNFYLKDIFLTPYGWADLIDTESIITISFLLYYLIYSLLSLITVYIWGRNSKLQSEKRQSAIIFIVSLISLMPSFLTNTMQIAYGVEFKIPAFAEVFILIWVAGIMFAIKKYNFLVREEEIKTLNEKIELEKKIVDIQSAFIKSQHYILETLFEYFKKNSEINNIYDFIADKIFQADNIKLLMLTEYDETNSKFILKAIRCQNEICKEFTKLIKSNLHEMSVSIIEDEHNFILEKLLSSQITKLNGGLYESILRSIDKHIVDEFASEYQLGDAYSIGFSSGDTLYGAATIITEKNKTLDNIDFLEILINVLSLILQKWETDNNLKKSELLHKSIFEYSDDCIFILDQNGIILSISPSFERITGYRVKDFAGKSMISLIHPEDREKSFHMLNEVINNNSRQRKVIRIINSKNETLYGEFAATKFILQNGEMGLLGIGRDVTERIKNEEIIKSYQKELELKTTKIETAGLLAAGVLHDLNNIIMNISAKIDKIKEDKLLPPDVKNYILDINKIIEVAKRLSRSLFKISGGIATDEINTSLKEIIDENIHLFSRDKRYKIITEIPENIPDIVLNYSQFIQIFNNLFINAVQAMPDGGTIKVSIFEKEVDNRKFVALEITDNGKGIPIEIQDKIFEPFFTTKPDGTGLGLPTIKSIIKTNNGDIYFKSIENKGTTFTVLIPVKQDIRRPEEFSSHQKEKIVPNRIKTVLIVDDNPNIRELTIDMLNHIGINAISASCQDEALKLMQNNNIDVVILDLHLNDDSQPIKTLEEIRKIKKEIKVIICSGSPKDPFLIRYISYGFDGVLAKPYNLSDLERILK